ncbi:MAG: efflux RND transporter periplasmic adaptor subunit [Arenimonas sp.]|nr:efflux RND transporter periplasmic adaptor subunit [Arenimonas sp.]
MTLRHLLLPLLLAFSLASCSGGETDDHAHGEGNEHDEPTLGTHGGRVLTQGAYALELAIYEEGVPPEYRAWLYRDGKPLPPTAGDLGVVLTRLGGTTDAHAFTPKDDFLVGNLEVYEPHSFDVEVTARIDGETLKWTYPSYEGRTTIAQDIATKSGIEIAAAGPGTIRDEHDVQGLLTPVEGRHARIVARFPGPVRAVRVGLGDEVRAGQTLATIESNVSLSDYAVTAPLAGTVLARNVAVGDLAGEQALFEIADLSTLWVDLHLFGADAQHITPGLPVEVTRLSDGVSTRTTLDRVLPGTATASQSTVARATVDNADGRWRPGAAVRARVTVAEQPVALMVPLAALQRYREWDVVFVRFGDEYEVRPLTLGRRDGVNVEVLAGLKAGDPVVIAQSYLVKADIEKSGASHDH